MMMVYVLLIAKSPYNRYYKNTTKYGRYLDEIEIFFK